MPQLREWMVNFPAYWTPAQANAYAKDTATQLLECFRNVGQALGVVPATQLFLSVIATGAQANPVWINDIQGAMARTYDVLQALRDPVEKVKH